jgi:hypothetical protein
VLLRLRCISRLPSGDWPWFRLLHAYLLYCLEISNAITKDIDDLNILNVQNGIPDVTEVLVKVTKAFIRLLNGFKGLCCGRPLVYPLEISKKQSIGVVP